MSNILKSTKSQCKGLFEFQIISFSFSLVVITLAGIALLKCCEPAVNLIPSNFAKIHTYLALLWSTFLCLDLHVSGCLGITFLRLEETLALAGPRRYTYNCVEALTIGVPCVLGSRGPGHTVLGECFVAIH